MILANKCPLCDETISPDSSIHICSSSDADPVLGPGSDILDSGFIEPDEAPLEETVAHRMTFTVAEAGASSWVDEDDGFPAVDDLADTTLGQYRLGRIIGRGSMGRVYRGEHISLGRPCAIKVMNPGLVAKKPKIRERFWAEARAVANLVHPHVVTVHNLGDDRGYHYIEMEYVPGGVSLKEVLIREGAFEPVRASTLVRQVVLALGAAHGSGLVHRDVKPSNVLLTASGQAKLADFGLVRNSSELLVAGVPIAGTPTYMAPELFEGIPASHRSDVYAVGVMYYYLLSERLPFASDQLGQLIQLHREEPVPDIRKIVPEISDFVATIIGRCLAKYPEQRYETAEELAGDLQSAIYQLRDTESLIEESLEGLGGFVQKSRESYRILFPVPGDRLQEVYIEVSQGERAERLLTVFSVCGPAEPGHFGFALRLNSSLTYGSLSIRNVNGEAMFVMARTYARDHVCSADIRAALLEIAGRADWVEQQLSHADLY